MADKNAKTATDHLILNDSGIVGSRGGKPAPPFTDEHVFEYVPSFMGGQADPNGPTNKLMCQLSYYALCLFLIYLYARWHTGFDCEADR